jgi:cytochrome c-type biogenesis protein CcmH/NrfG
MTSPPAGVISKYETEASQNPESAEAKCNLGWGYYGARQYDAAIAAFKEALQLDAGSVDTLYGLGLSLKEAGVHGEAIPVFKKVMRLAPERAPGARGMMLARLARGHINQIKTGEWDLDEDLRYESSSDDDQFQPI